MVWYPPHHDLIHTLHFSPSWNLKKTYKILWDSRKLPMFWHIKTLLGNNFLLWMTRTDEFPDLPVHPKEMAFGCLLVGHPLHTVLYSFHCIWTAVLHKVLWTPLKETLHALSFKSSFPFSCVPKDTNGCSVTEGLYFLLSTMGLCITVSNFSPDCAISLGDV